MQRRFKGAVPLLDAEDDLRVDSAVYRKLTRRQEALEDMLKEHKLAKCQDLDDRLAQLARKASLAQRAKVRSAGQHWVA